MSKDDKNVEDVEDSGDRPNMEETQSDGDLRDRTPPAGSDPDALFEEQKEEEGEIEEYSSKLAVFSHKPVQIILGWVFGFLIWFCMAIGVMNSENELLSWLFLIVFAIAMLGRNYFERDGISMRTFMKHFLISLIVFLGVFLLLGWTGVISMT